jgi:cytochrome c-type biogenesis protein
VFDLPLALAFAGGLVATVNPCGFAMLPAYLSFFVSLDSDAPQRGPESILRGLRVGLVVSAGFLVVFGLAGLLLSTGAQLVIGVIPWMAIVVGVALAALGLWLLSGRDLPVKLPGPKRGTTGRRPAALMGFGIAYALASLSCTLPVFLTVVAGTLTRSSVSGGIAMFAAYAAGMTLPLLGISVALALGKGAAVRRLRAFTRYANRVAGGLLVAAGGYIVLFWVVSLSAGRRTTPGLVRAVELLSSRITNALGGRPMAVGAALAILVAAAAVYARLARHRSQDPRGAADPPVDEPPGDDPPAEQQVTHEPAAPPRRGSSP